jgi:hypothetical protein
MFVILYVYFVKLGIDDMHIFMSVWFSMGREPAAPWAVRKVRIVRI